MAWLTTSNMAMVRRLSRSKLGGLQSTSHSVALGNTRINRVHPMVVQANVNVVGGRPHDLANATNEKRRMVTEIRSITSLIFITAVSFAICQISYVFWRLLWIFHGTVRSLDVCDHVDAFRSSMRMHYFVQFSIMSTYVCEAMSRSLNFYFYLMFNTSFRNEFTASIKYLFSELMALKQCAN
ncbi:unnamed protein product [Soboliphyme baturini]|uniref:G-protein coupled receptors family 1 profile domain-containing protein n=1 Tax=Soboliphyme baturini TaxID=241478 RepID=A0A183IM36_9BILA|nr:unnamed protein product [Soboliphyme baturini]